MPRKTLPHLRVRNFAQISRADLELGDLTVFVGSQATGKSLALQLFKLCIDGQRVARALSDSGMFHDDDPRTFAEQMFGEGMGGVWRKNTRVDLSGKALRLDLLAKSRQLGSEHRVFYVPAQRALAIADGWPGGFRSGPLGTPFVVRWFGEMLRLLLSDASGLLFPIEGKLKEPLRRVIDDAVFHGAPLGLVTIRGRTELRLGAGADDSLPVIAWTAGQREFVPLLVALYALIPSGHKPRVPTVDWIVLEEPEMGLHPQGILAVMLLVLELLSRGYKVILSTHHPLILDVIWALRRIKEHRKRGAAVRVLEVFGLGAEGALRALAQSALDREYRVTAFAYDDANVARVTTTDISSLDPGHANETVAGWGGLTGYSGRIGDVVAKVVS